MATTHRDGPHATEAFSEPAAAKEPKPPDDRRRSEAAHRLAGGPTSRGLRARLGARFLGAVAALVMLTAAVALLASTLPRNSAAVPGASSTIEPSPTSEVTCRLAAADCQPALDAAETAVRLHVPAAAMPPETVLLVGSGACGTIPDPPPDYDLCSAPSIPGVPGVSTREVGIAAVTFRGGYGRAFVLILQPIFGSGPGAMWGLTMTMVSASTPAVTPAPSATPGALPSPSVRPTPDSVTVGGFLWDRIDSQFGGAQPGPMTVLGSQLVMATSPFGSVSPGSAMPHPTFWRSSDGSSWQRLPDSPAFAGVQEKWIDVALGLTSYGSGLIAVGMQEYADGSTANAEAWNSLDGGRTWVRASVADPTQATMNFVYPVSGGFVAIGTAGYSFHAGMEGGTAIWTSSNGRYWTRLPQSEVPSRVSMGGVAYGHGRYVAVGMNLPPGGSSTGPVPIWTSTDGIHFTTIARTVGDPAADMIVRQVIWTGSAFVAVGNPLSLTAPYAWRSTNGIDWRQVAPPTDTAVGSQVRVESIARTATGLIAVGALDDTIHGTTTAGIVWESSDGRSWQQVSQPSDFPGIDLQAATAVGAGHILVEGADINDGHTLLWLLDPGPAGN